MTEGRKTLCIYTALGIGVLLLVGLLGGCAATKAEPISDSVQALGGGEAEIEQTAQGTGPLGFGNVHTRTVASVKRQAPPPPAPPMSVDNMAVNTDTMDELDKCKHSAPGGDACMCYVNVPAQARNLSEYFMTNCTGKVQAPPVAVKPAVNSTPPVVLIDDGEFDRRVERVEGKGKEWANDGAEKAFASVNKHMQWEALSDGCKDAAGDVYAAMDPDYTGSWNWLVNLTANPKALDTWSGLQDFVDMNTQDGGEKIIALDGKCP